MTKKCELTGKRPLKGHKVSHANNKVKRRFLPGIKKVNFKSDILNKSLRLNEPPILLLKLLVTSQIEMKFCRMI